MDIIQEYYYNKGKLEVIDKLQSDSFTPCRQSNKLKHYLDTQKIHLESELERLTNEYNQLGQL